MVQLVCTLRNQNQIIAELINNIFVNEWIEQFKIVNSLCDFDQMYFSPVTMNKTWNNKKISTYETEIKESIINLNRLNTNFPVTIDEIKITNDQNGRDLLNRLHRYFTTGHRTASEEKITIWQENTNLYFTLDRSNYPEFAYWVHQINDYVHLAETYFINDRKLNFPMTKEWLVLYSSQSYRGENNSFQYFKTIKNEHHQYYSDNMDYDIWLPLSQIQGKNYLQAYVDEDDPTNWDISSNIFYSGSFSLGDRSWYMNEDLQNYLISYGINPCAQTCGIPLGRIVSGKDYLTNIQFNKIVEIKLYE